MARAANPEGLTVEISPTGRLSTETLDELRALFFAAFDYRFDEEDWHHALGGVHVVLREAAGGRVVAHAAVIERRLLVGDRPVRSGYVEAVAALPARQRQGLGRVVMTEVSRLLQSGFEMGALATGVGAFYRALGWEDWRGPTGAYDDEGAVMPTPDEDGAVMVLRYGPSAGLDLNLPIAAPARSGDDW